MNLRGRLGSITKTLDLCLSLFPWAKFRQTKGAVKLHVGLDHDGHLPTFVHITDGKTSDIKGAQSLALPKGSISSCPSPRPARLLKSPPGSP